MAHSMEQKQRLLLAPTAVGANDMHMYITCTTDICWLKVHSCTCIYIFAIVAEQRCKLITPGSLENSGLTGEIQKQHIHMYTMRINIHVQYVVHTSHMYKSKVMPQWLSSNYEEDRQPSKRLLHVHVQYGQPSVLHVHDT